MKNLSVILLLLFFGVACTTSTEKKPVNPMNIVKTEFGKLPSGQMAYLYTLENSQGVRMSVTDYGGIITELWVPDRDGALGDVVLGYSNLQAYLDGSPYFGSITGRYANRIARGKFSIDSVEYTLAQNNGVNHLHGGDVGFDKVMWETREIKTENKIGLEFTRMSAHLEEGYPGNLNVKVRYWLTEDNAVEMEYEAISDQTTVVNLTNHSYWNLTGDPGSTALDHVLTLSADNYLPVDSTLIPTGKLESVENTPFDFTSEFRIGERIEEDHPQLVIGLGYDHCWVFNKRMGELASTGILKDPKSGRVMEMLTTEPGVQFYSGNFLDGSLTGKEDKVYARRNAVCLETQHFPDSPNQSQFPSTLIKAGETYISKTVYRFTAE